MPSRPAVIVFDVNETLSDMAPLAQRFGDVGAPPQLAGEWFAALLRDGFALAAAGSSAPFATIAAELLRSRLAGFPLDREPGDAVAHILGGFRELGLHADVADGIRALGAAGNRLVTLTNGSAQIAQKLLGDAGLADQFEAFLTVENAPVWKPARAAYLHAVVRCGALPADMLLVAVHPWDIHGASLAGLRTAWVNRSGAAYPSYFAAPDHVVTGIDGLAAIVG
jgi:2-haloacid dehalogenase